MPQVFCVFCKTKREIKSPEFSVETKEDGSRLATISGVCVECGKKTFHILILKYGENPQSVADVFNIEQAKRDKQKREETGEKIISVIGGIIGVIIVFVVIIVIIAVIKWAFGVVF